MRMFGYLTLVAVMAVALGVVAVGCKEQATPKTGTPAAKTDAPAATEIAQKVCPVMGGKIDPKIYADYNGRRIYFCCPMCPPKFKKDPEKYIKKVDEQLAADAAKK